MLRYLGTGQRYYGSHPMRVYCRGCWEFQSVVDGRLQPIFRSGNPPLAEKRLWAFPPSVAHGWEGDGHQACEVIVFHLASVPEQVRQAAEEDGYLCCDLTDEDISKLRDLARIAADNLRHPTALSALHYQQIQITVSLLALRQRPVQRLARTEATARTVVDNAIAWYNEHLPEAPNLDTVAEAVYVSPAHLRRLFHRILDASPRQALDQIRFGRAMQLLEEGLLNADQVAEACGFSSASAFSRGFKNWHGCSPRDWLRAKKPARHKHTQ